jgi:GNAT superfamily N-acetyltransferase
MTEVQHRSASSGSAAAPRVTIRPYRPADHGACRGLWAELVEHRNRLFGNRPLEHDAGAGFEEYLTQLNLSGMWVADHEEDGVCGFVGLRLDGREGEVEPVVVTAALRGRGIGRALLTRVADEARRRGLTQLTISPAARDRAALRSLHTAGFDTVASVTLSYALRGPAPSSPQDATLDLYDLHFDS